MLNRTIPACLLFLAAAMAQAVVLTALDTPLRLIRGTTVYKAANGVALQKDDILESGAGGAQVEVGPGIIVALGPQTRIMLNNLPADGRGALEVALLSGWLKVQDKAGQATVVTPALQVSLANGSTIVQAAGGQDAVFAEEGEQQLARAGKPDAGSKAPFRLASEQYAALEAGKPLSAGRPPRTFVAAMPPNFRDRLAPAPDMPAPGKVRPAREREVDFADMQDWLRAPLPIRKRFVARLKPRLADPAFRKALDGALGQTPDWKPVLHPPPPRPIQEKSP